MGLHLSRHGYSVRVEDMSLRDSRFVIKAEIAYAAHLSEEERMRLTPMAELDVLLGIEGAELRWRRGTPARASRRAGLVGRGGQPGLAVKQVQET